MSASSTNASAYTLMPLVNSTLNNHVTHSGPLAIDVTFQLQEVRDRGKTDSLLINVKLVADFQQWFSESARVTEYPLQIHCCKRPNYDSWISQGSAATISRWGGQNNSRLCQASSRCYMPMFHEVIPKITLVQFFFWDTVYNRFTNLKKLTSDQYFQH